MSTIFENNLNNMSSQQRNKLREIRDRVLDKGNKDSSLIWKTLHCYVNVYLKTKENPVEFYTYKRIMECDVEELYVMTVDREEYVDRINEL